MYGLILFSLSCKSSSDPDPQSGTGSFCKEVSIKTSGLDYAQKATFDDQLRIVGLTTTEDNQTTNRTYSYDADGKLKDSSGDISTDYKNGVLDAIRLHGAVFAVNPTGQLTNVTITTDDGDVLKYTYSYDANGDPTSIKGTAASNGKVEQNDFVLDYLGDRLNGLPGTQQAQFVFLSMIYYAVPITSKHLLNKWVRNYTAAGKSFSFTQQYTYTFDGQGRMGSFVHTGNPNNTFNLTYAQCQ